MNTKHTGDLSQLMVMAALLRQGYTVLEPYGDNQRYDLVIDDEGTFNRIQVKTGRVYSGVIRFETCSSYAHRGGKKKDYRGQIDLFAVYCPELDRVYLVPVEETGAQSGRLRIAPSRNAQEKGVRWAKDYEVIPR